MSPPMRANLEPLHLPHSHAKNTRFLFLRSPLAPSCRNQNQPPMKSPTLHGVERFIYARIRNNTRWFLVRTTEPLQRRTTTTNKKDAAEPMSI